MVWRAALVGVLLAQISAAAPSLNGLELAKTYCASCHVFPEPSLLTKVEWTHHIMPGMALWLGIERPDFEALPDGKILEEAKLYPNAPLLSQKDWFAIWDYYKAEAPEEQPRRPRAKIQIEPGRFRVHKVNFHTGAPMISTVKIDAARKQIYVGDAFANIFATLDISGKVLSKERTPSPLVSLQTGKDGLLLTHIGKLFPSDVTEGSITASGKELLTKLRRPTDARAADLNDDGREDLVVCEFGHRLGGVAWYENLGNGQYERHDLLDRPGAIRSELRDMNGDGKVDIVLLTAQAREGLYIYYNQGGGKFRVETIMEQPPAFGYADFQFVDWDRDRDLDLLTANGDNGDFPTPHKPYHGVRLYLNNGSNVFKQVSFFPMEGAYKVLPLDFDMDGDMDLAAISFYPDFSSEPLNFVLLENRGTMQFRPFTIPEAGLGRWMVMDAGDLDGDGDTDLVLGSFVLGPTTIPVPAALHEHWKNEGAAVLILENTVR